MNALKIEIVKIIMNSRRIYLLERLTSMNTSSGTLSRMSCLMVRSSASRSIRRLWIRSCHLSKVLVPFPDGAFRVVILSFFVGSGCGPRALIPVRSVMSLISLQTTCRLGRLLLVNLILAV